LRVLITGGSGFIGRNLAELLAPKYDLRAPTSSELNLLNEQDTRQYLQAHHFDVIIHSATTRSNRRLAAPPDLLDRNCRMFFNLLRNKEIFGKFIHFGSGAEYGPREHLPSRVKEEYFDTLVPRDAYGFSKYISAKHIDAIFRASEATVLMSESKGDIVELRLFGVFGPYEDYTVRFISNACCRALRGLQIILRQDVIFDYLYVKDLAAITEWFIENDAPHAAYNVCSGNPIRLMDLARIVAEISGKNPVIRVAATGMGPEYTGDNSRLLKEIGAYRFWDLRDSVAELYGWYAARSNEIDPGLLHFDKA